MVDEVEFASGRPGGGGLNVRWIHGSPSLRHRTDPPIQVHAYDEHTFVLRESKDVSYEAPFLYLLFGNRRALLVDTGATADAARFPLRTTVDGLVDAWLARHPRENYELVVAHSHSHLDHRAGDPQFAGRPRTTIVEKEPDRVRAFFGLSEDLDAIARFDLGGRVLEVLSIPGHHPASIAIYDPATGFLLTGDTVCPGRLYAFDYPAFAASLQRLANFADRHAVTYVMGGHVEMSETPGEDYPVGSLYQPHERPVQMAASRLVAVRDAAESLRSAPGAYPFEDFWIYHGPCTGALLHQVVRGKLRNLCHRLFGPPA